MVLFAELERLAVVIGDELAGGETLAISERGQPPVILSARTPQVSHEFLVERGAALLERLVVARSGLEQIRGFPAIATPVRPEVFAHVLNRVEIVVGEHEPARHRLAGNLDVEKCKLCRGNFGSGGRPRLGIRRVGSLNNPRVRPARLRRRHIEVAPIDAQIVALLRQDRLFF